MAKILKQAGLVPEAIFGNRCHVKTIDGSRSMNIFPIRLIHMRGGNVLINYYRSSWDGRPNKQSGIRSINTKLIESIKIANFK